MHAIELARLAATLSLSARYLLEDCTHVGEQVLTEYWTASRCRLDHWGRALRRLAHPERGAECHENLAGLAEDILISQIHCRIVAAICVLHDHRRERCEAGPVARNTLVAHQEAVDRLLALVKRRPASSGLPLRIRAIGSAARRWNDMLVGYLLPLSHAPAGATPDGHAVEFAFEPARCVEFAWDAQSHLSRSIAEVDSLLGASIQHAFSPALGQPPRIDLNLRIASATLALFGPAAFDDFGMLRSTWIARLSHATDETLAIVESLFDDREADLPVVRREGRF